MTEAVDCIFCKIVRNEIPSSRILESDKFIAFLDVHPVNKGHTLVVSKEHLETLLDIPENTLKDMMAAAKKIAKSMRKVLKADGVNIGMNNFAAAGQEVMHAHIHVIPRFENDGLHHWPSKNYEEGEMDKVREMLATFV